MKRKMVINPSKCIGCSLCSLTCTMTYNKIFGLGKGHIKVKRLDDDGNFEIIFLSTCKHCLKCAEACPTSCLSIVEIPDSEEGVEAK